MTFRIYIFIYHLSGILTFIYIYRTTPTWKISACRKAVFSLGRARKKKVFQYAKNGLRSTKAWRRLLDDLARHVYLDLQVNRSRNVQGNGGCRRVLFVFRQTVASFALLVALFASFGYVTNPRWIRVRRPGRPRERNALIGFTAGDPLSI